MMPIKIVPKFTAGQIGKMLQKQQERIEKAIVLRLSFVGEAFVKSAREDGNYKDHTGNLRSSIGYVILKNGQQLHDNFLSVGGKDGIEKAKKALENAKAKFPGKGYVLICVAGMEYAAAVESKGYNVITASSLVAEKDLKDGFQKLQDKIDKSV
jgi:hypothetical protein